jgi:hypothetical protein
MPLSPLHPGALPTKPSPKIGHRLTFKVDGFPPYKDFKTSIRNPRNKNHDRFLRLRKAATKAMRGRRWSDYAISLTISIFAPSLEKGMEVINYASGIFDTLGGSHGQNFTYLPIVYQDDVQAHLGEHRFHESAKTYYVIKIRFLGKRSSSWK